MAKKGAEMTLYERIMMYRKLKEGDEVKYKQQQQQQKQHQQEYSQRSERVLPRQSSSTDSSSNNNNNMDNTSSASRKLERSDSSFGSVDLSELTGMAGEGEEEEEKNRSPTPLPTFDYLPRAADKTGGQSDHEEHSTTRELHVQVEDQVTDRQTSSAMADAAVSMATVSMTTRAQSSTAERREVRKTNREERRNSVYSSGSRDRVEHATHNTQTHTHSDQEKSEIAKKDEKTARSPAKVESSPGKVQELSPESEFLTKVGEREYRQTIDALEKLAEKNLQRLLGEGEGEEVNEMDRKLLDKVFSPQFQAQLDRFLQTT
ncbi:hypothetical protein ACOMHN_018505 [Nucella lapillus]